MHVGGTFAQYGMIVHHLGVGGTSITAETMVNSMLLLLGMEVDDGVDGV